jgi:hypothetical protein
MIIKRTEKNIYKLFFLLVLKNEAVIFVLEEEEK